MDEVREICEVLSWSVESERCTVSASTPWRPAPWPEVCEKGLCGRSWKPCDVCARACAGLSERPGRPYVGDSAPVCSRHSSFTRLFFERFHGVEIRSRSALLCPLFTVEPPRIATSTRRDRCILDATVGPAIGRSFFLFFLFKKPYR